MKSRLPVIRKGEKYGAYSILMHAMGIRDEAPSKCNVCGKRQYLPVSFYKNLKDSKCHCAELEPKKQKGKK